jgi:hypothetical protein
VNTSIHDSLLWDRRTLKRVALHRKKLAPLGCPMPDIAWRGKAHRRKIPKIPRRIGSFPANARVSATGRLP